MKEHVCSIYVLFNKDGVIDYVGRTSRPIAKRLYEHKAVLGFMPNYEIVATCSNNCREVERHWIGYYRENGYILRNISYGQGPHFLPAESRAKISAAFKGRPVTWGDKISATQKGIKKNWSPEGEQRVAATRFKKGENPFAKLSEEAKARWRKAARDMWNDPERRKKMTPNNKKGMRVVL